MLDKYLAKKLLVEKIEVLHWMEDLIQNRTVVVLKL